MNQNSSLRNYLLEECLAMVKYLSANGTPIPNSVHKIMKYGNGNCDELDVEEEEILALHKQLSIKIAPAHPRSIWLLYKEAQKGSWHNFLGPVGLVRRLMLTALLSLVIFIAVSLSPDVNTKTIQEGIFENGGWPLFQILVFFLASASLGGCFSNLFEANHYIMKGTFDPKYECAYWIRYVLGIIAGLMLAVLFPVPDSWGEGQAFEMNFLSLPLLSMLGGFSASLLYRVLNRAVTTVETFLTGKTQENYSSNHVEILDKQQQESLKEKKHLVEMLLTLKNESNDRKTKEKIDQTLESMIN